MGNRVRKCDVGDGLGSAGWSIIIGSFKGSVVLRARLMMVRSGKRHHKIGKVRSRGRYHGRHSGQHQKKK